MSVAVGINLDVNPIVPLEDEHISMFSHWPSIKARPDYCDLLLCPVIINIRTPGKKSISFAISRTVLVKLFNSSQHL